MSTFTKVLLSVIVVNLLLVHSYGQEVCIPAPGNFPEEPGPQDCVAKSCLLCMDVAASCIVDNVTQTLNCSVTDPSECSLQNCSRCGFCSATYAFDRLRSSWETTSFCFNLTNDVCKNHGSIHPECLADTAVTLEELETSPDIARGCACYEDEHCVENMVMNITTNATSVAPTNIMSNITDGGTPSELDPAYIAVMVVIGIVLLVIIVVVTVVGSWYLKRKVGSRTRSQPRSNRFETEMSELDLPVNLLNVIGRGRFGCVYRAEYNDEVVAVKMFNYHNRQSWENEREVYSMESTPHQNILEYIGSESRGSRYDVQLCTITRYHSLGSLDSFLRQHTVTWKQALAMIHSVAGGVTHLHSDTYLNSSDFIAEKYAVAHRDMKSANVLVKNGSGECVICDLGLALVLDPSADVKDLANSGQVGTFRYMAPEALDARVNLHDIQSFKQIDIYAMALIIWEIASRCTALEAPDAIPPYQAAFEDMVGERPSLELMKDIVVSRKLRPALPAAWRNHQGLEVVVEIIQECWDDDPEARLTAANVFLRAEGLTNNLAQEEERGTAENNTNESSDCRDGAQTAPNSGDTATTTTRAHARVNVSQSLFDDVPMSMQAPPPPYYSSYHLGRDGASMMSRRPRFQSSMPHLDSRTWVETGVNANRYGYGVPPAYGTNSFRNSVVIEGTPEVVESSAQERKESNSVRNSLILGVSTGGDQNATANYELLLETLSSTGDLLDPDHHARESALDDRESSDEHLNSDSGFLGSQPRHSGATSEGSEFTSLQPRHSGATSEGSEFTSFPNGVPSGLEDSTDTLEALPTGPGGTAV